jgi:hypothetical protein
MLCKIEYLSLVCFLSYVQTDVSAEKGLAIPSAIPSTMQNKQCRLLTITTKDFYKWPRL